MTNISSLFADKLLHSTTAKILEALVELQRRRLGFRRLRGGTVIREADLIDQTQYSGMLGPNGKVKSKRLYGTSRPTRFLIELHQMPVGCGAYHRQATVGASNPGMETFAVMSGSGIFLHKEGRDWRVFEIEQGNCGFYDGGEDHIWLNPSLAMPLITFQTFFPHNISKPEETVVSSDGKVKVLPGAACEFELHSLPDCLPDDVRSQVETVLQKLCVQK